MEVSSLELPPPLSLVGIIGIIIVYLIICYLILDLIGHFEEPGGQNSHPDDAYSGVSLEELQAIACFYHLGAANLAVSCAICLDSLQSAELCRVFPACNHVFHAHCIDPWLATRLTCPTCRAPFSLLRNFRSSRRRS